jgi:hypothetical protein
VSIIVNFGAGWLVDGRRHAPAAVPPEKSRCPLYRRLVGPQSRSGRVGNISPPPPTGFDPRTVQPVTSRYTVFQLKWNCIPCGVGLAPLLIQASFTRCLHARFVTSRGMDVSAGKLQTGRCTSGLVRFKHCIKKYLLTDIKLQHTNILWPYH